MIDPLRRRRPGSGPSGSSGSLNSRARKVADGRSSWSGSLQTMERRPVAKRDLQAFLAGSVRRCRLRIYSRPMLLTSQTCPAGRINPARPALPPATVAACQDKGVYHGQRMNRGVTNRGAQRCRSTLPAAAFETAANTRVPTDSRTPNWRYRPLPAVREGHDHDIQASLQSCGFNRSMQ